MNRRRILLLVLCTLLAVGAPLAYAFAADAPCASAGAPCDDCGGADMSACAFACAAGSAGFASLQADRGSPILPASNAVSSAPAYRFASIAGPPGLQPPR